VEGSKKTNTIPLGVTIGGYTFEPPLVRGDLSTVEGVFNFIISLLNFAVGFSALVAVIMIIVSGYLFITAAGDPDKIQKGTNALTAAVVGLLIVFLARTLVVFLLRNILN
jgi:type IV secretory pathway VirB2 component (pilin)